MQPDLVEEEVAAKTAEEEEVRQLEVEGIQGAKYSEVGEEPMPPM